MTEVAGKSDKALALTVAPDVDGNLGVFNHCSHANVVSFLRDDYVLKGLYRVHHGGLFDHLYSKTNLSQLYTDLDQSKSRVAINNTARTSPRVYQPEDCFEPFAQLLLVLICAGFVFVLTMASRQMIPVLAQ